MKNVGDRVYESIYYLSLEGLTVETNEYEVMYADVSAIRLSNGKQIICRDVNYKTFLKYSTATIKLWFFADNQSDLERLAEKARKQLQKTIDDRLRFYAELNEVMLSSSETTQIS